MRAGLSFVSVAEVGGQAMLPALEGLAAEIFGGGSRPGGWFERKLRREHVDMDMSVIAVDGDPEDPASWLGYALLGTPPSLGATARAAGFGLRPAARGRGVGSALVEQALASAARRGREHVRLLAQPELVAFYEKLGFRGMRPWETWRSSGEGDDADELPDPGPWTLPGVFLELTGWMVEAWRGTEEERRHTLWYDLDGVEMVAHVSREGQAFLVQRLCIGSLDLGLDALREVRWALPTDAPIFITGVNPAGLVGELLDEAGFEVAQQGLVMERSAARPG